MERERWRGFVSKSVITLLLAAVLAACGTRGTPPGEPHAPAPGGPTGSPPAAANPPPAATAPEPAQPPAGEKPASPAENKLPDGCKPGDTQRRWANPDNPSPLTAWVYVKDDPGIHAPIRAFIPGLPVTVVVRFSGPVDRTSFQPILGDTRCDYVHGPIEQETRWLSDREAEVTVKSLPAGKPGPYAINFLGGTDTQGKSLNEPGFALHLATDYKVAVYAAPVTGGPHRKLYERQGHIQAASVSPDGRYLVALRTIRTLSSSHSPVRIPYIIEMQTGRLTALERGPIERITWVADGVWLSGRRKVTTTDALWVEGWPRPDNSADTGEKALQLLPPGTGYVMEAALSRDGRWLAAVRTPQQNDKSGKADLMLVEVATGKAQVMRNAVGYLEAPNGPPYAGLSWDPQGAGLLVTSYQRKEGSVEDGAAEHRLIDPVTLASKPFVLEGHEAPKFLSWSPSGQYLHAPGTGIFSRDGRLVQKVNTFGGLLWSPGDRYVVIHGEQLLEIATGKRTTISPPAGIPNAGLIGLSGDGATAYFAQNSNR